MDSEELKTVAAIICPMVATASLAVNVFQAWLLRTRTPTASRIQEVRDALRTILGQFDSSMIFSIPPHIEVWDKGFESIALIRQTLATSNTVIRHARSDLVPENI